MYSIDEINENDFIEITEEFLEQGMKSGCGINNAQLKMLGVELPVKKGWKEKILGKKISKENAQKFFDLKGTKKGQRKKIIENKVDSSEKTENISLNHWEILTIYSLVKNQYCRIAQVLQNTELRKDYIDLINKLKGLHSLTQNSKKQNIRI